MDKDLNSSTEGVEPFCAPYQSLFLPIGCTGGYSNSGLSGHYFKYKKMKFIKITSLICALKLTVLKRLITRHMYTLPHIGTIAFLYLTLFSFCVVGQSSKNDKDLTGSVVVRVYETRGGPLIHVDGKPVPPRFFMVNIIQERSP
ncbi:MAG: hypothetical protein A2W90_19070 [Bacteroidetes bacterium GWF2_42_66]|nr:MAG: hypothetical protein A2W89_10625 [Bacteroidetes bacterium GWE2_42_39]OFY43073.1 MAG: hypothetical protein A2W90_19070 [Bacteroidetes bacterium GWF2_42_66]HBL77083.1 hypothetical protein [Prolixibacteraceae bacterium]HCU59863.1 hypothetical protein [Prolixibacteraceae bacterium]